MSKVNAIRPDYFRHQNSKRKSEDSSQQSFGRDSAELSQKIASACEKEMTGGIVKVYDFLSLNEGEVETQAINALFTSTLAPLVIRYNPASKKPKEDKAYLAWRQPLSAVIAVAGGLPATMWINKQVANLASNGYFKNLDIRMCPHKDYLQPGFKKMYRQYKKSENLSGMAKELGFDGEISGSKWPHLWLYDRAKLKNAYADKYKRETSEFFAALLSSDIKDIGMNDKKEIVIKNKNIKPRAIPRMESMDDVIDYHSKYSLKNRSFGDFMRESFGFEFFADKKLKSGIARELIDQVKAKEFLETIGLYKDIKPEIVEKICGVARTAKAEQELGNSIPKKAVGEISKLTIRHIDHRLGKNTSSKSNLSLDQLFERLGLIDGDESKKLTDLEGLMNEKVDTVLFKIKSKIEKLKGADQKFEKDGKKLIEKVIDGKKQLVKEKVPMDIGDFALNYMGRLAKNNEDKFKNILKVTGIVGNLFVVLVTCSILNWVYPKFMDTVFPNLSKSKTENEQKKGGNK